LLHAFGSDHRPGVAEWTGPSLLDHHTLTKRRLCEGGGGCGYLLPLGPWIYVPEGRGYWYRIHRETFEVQPVLREGATNHPYTGIFSISAHYGIVVTTCGDGLHYRPYSQIRIHEPP
ncbi:MAG: hypothetical protein EA424_24630, partial [Planctomycetaceae bacterium]